MQWGGLRKRERSNDGKAGTKKKGSLAPVNKPPVGRTEGRKVLDLSKEHAKNTKRRKKPHVGGKGDDRHVQWKNGKR